MRCSHRSLAPPMSHRSSLRTRAIACAAANDTLDIEYQEDRNSWDAFVTKINDALNPLDLEFSRLHDEVNGTELYAVVGLLRDLTGKLVPTLVYDRSTAKVTRSRKWRQSTRRSRSLTSKLWYACQTS